MIVFILKIEKDWWRVDSYYVFGIEGELVIRIELRFSVFKVIGYFCSRDDKIKIYIN